MALDDPNAFLGEPEVFLVFLFAAVTLAAGVFLVTCVARVWSIPVWLPVVTLVVQMLVGMASYILLGPFSMSEDGGTYDQQAVYFASGFGLRTPFGFEQPLHDGKAGYPTLLGLAYVLTGRQPFVGIAINTVAVALTSIVVYAAARKAFSRVNPYIILVYFVVAPFYITLGPSIMREALCWLGIALCSYALVCYLRGVDLVPATMVLAVGVLVLYFVRTGLLWLTLGALAVAIGTVVLWRSFGTRSLVLWALLGLVLLLVIGEPLLSLAGYSSEYVIANREFNAIGANTGFSVTVGPLVAFGITGYMIAALPKLLIGPLPWELEPMLVWAWVLGNTVFWWFALWQTLRIGRSRGLNSQFVGLVCAAAVMLVAMAAFNSNYGVLSRMRALPLIILLIIMAGGMIGSQSKSRETAV